PTCYKLDAESHQGSRSTGERSVSGPHHPARNPDRLPGGRRHLRSPSESNATSGRNSARRKSNRGRPDLDPRGGEAAIKAVAKIIWADPAIQDLEAIADYIALEKPGAAR